MNAYVTPCNNPRQRHRPAIANRKTSSPKAERRMLVTELLALYVCMDTVFVAGHFVNVVTWFTQAHGQLTPVEIHQWCILYEVSNL